MYWRPRSPPRQHYTERGRLLQVMQLLKLNTLACLEETSRWKDLRQLILNIRDELFLCKTNLHSAGSGSLGSLYVDRFLG